MKLILVDDEGVYLDSVDVAEDEFDYAKQDGGAATLILGELLPFRDGNEPKYVCVQHMEHETQSVEYYLADSNYPNKLKSAD